MSKDLEQLNLVIESNLKAAEEARAYISITNEQGPSEQLLAFINFDNKLEDEIGFEGYNTLSLQARHEILLSKLDPTALQTVAIEGFINKLIGSKDKVEKHVEKIEEDLGDVHDVIKLNPKDFELREHSNRFKLPSLVSYNGFKKMKTAIEGLFSLEHQLAESIPHEFSFKAWDTFTDNYYGGGDLGNKKWHLKRDSLEKQYNDGKLNGRTDIIKSGWTPENIISEFKWLHEMRRKLDDAEDKYVDLINKLISFFNSNRKSNDPEVIKLLNLIYDTPLLTGDIYSNTYAFIRDIHGSLLGPYVFLKRKTEK